MIRNCKVCKKEFYTIPSVIRGGGGKFCSFECYKMFPRKTRVVVVNCNFCKKDFAAKPWLVKNGFSKFCSRECKDSFGKTGHKTRQGYIKITVAGRQVFEHRYIIQKIIGRKLKKFETVHHKNGNRSDNRLANLQIFANAHGYGQSIRDLRDYLKTIPKRLGGLK